MSTRNKSGAFVSLLLFMTLAFVVGAFFGEDIRAMVRAAEGTPGTYQPVQATPSTPPPPQASPAATPPATTPAANMQTMQLHVPAIQVYAVQLAIFSTPENAREDRERLQQLGVQSILYETNGRYRLLDSVYTQQADAQVVREQYMQRNIDAYVVLLDSGSIYWSLTATEEANSLVEAAVQQARRQIVLALGLPAQIRDGTQADICEQAAQIAEQLRSQSDILTRVFETQSSDLLEQLTDMLGTTAALMDEVAGLHNTDRLEFISVLQYNVLQGMAHYTHVASAQ